MGDTTEKKSRIIRKNFPKFRKKSPNFRFKNQFKRLNKYIKSINRFNQLGANYFRQSDPTKS